MSEPINERRLHVVQDEPAPEPEPPFREVQADLLHLLATLRHTVKEYDLPVGRVRWWEVEDLFDSLSPFEVICPRCGAATWRPCLITVGPYTGNRRPDVHAARTKRKPGPGWLRYEIEVKS